MQEAFLKSGMVTEEGIINSNLKQEQEEKRKKIQQQKEQKQKEEQRKQDLQKQKDIEAAWEEQNKQKEKQAQHRPTKNVFDKMYDDPKKLKFLIHLLWNFLPAERAHFLFHWEDRLKKRACCICNVRVVSKTEVIEKIPAMSEAFVKALPQIIDGKSIGQVQIENIKEVFKEKVFIALSSADSNAVFCPECYQEFFEWIFGRLAANDEKVNRIVGSLRKKYPSFKE